MGDHRLARGARVAERVRAQRLQGWLSGVGKHRREHRPNGAGDRFPCFQVSDITLLITVTLLVMYDLKNQIVGVLRTTDPTSRFCNYASGSDDV